MHKYVSPVKHDRKTEEIRKNIFLCLFPIAETLQSPFDLGPSDYCLCSALKEQCAKYNLVPKCVRLLQIMQTKPASIPRKIIKDSCIFWTSRALEVQTNVDKLIFIVDKLIFIVQLLSLCSTFWCSFSQWHLTANIFKFAHKVTVKKPVAPDI